MADNVTSDALLLLRIEGMHCHKCAQAISRSMGRIRAVHEVEVDFASGQASVLYERGGATVRQLTEAVEEAGYRVTGFTQGAATAAAE